MKAKLKKFGVGTEYMGEISDCWAKIQLNNGLKIQVFERKCTILKAKKDDIINCLILCFYAQDINTVKYSNGHDIEKPILHGRYIHEYSIPKLWWNYNPKFKSRKYPAVQTVNGIFLLNFFDNQEHLKDGDLISFTVGRLDLLAWYPIE